MAAKRDGAKSRKMDYQQQIERWNKYQEILDEIGKKCNRRVADVRLARNVYTLSMAGEAENARVHGKPKRCTTGDDRQRKGSGSRARKEIRMTIERCEKCGKSFMRQS